MEYSYKKSKVNSLGNFLRENGSNFIVIYTPDNREQLEILDNDIESLKSVVGLFDNARTYIANIDSNIYLPLKEFFIPYKTQIVASMNFNTEMLNKLYRIDFVEFSFKDDVLTIMKEESKSKKYIKYKDKKESLDKMGLRHFGKHVVLRNNVKLEESIIPLYSFEDRSFYYTGAKSISPINIFVE